MIVFLVRSQQACYCSRPISEAVWNHKQTHMDEQADKESYIADVHR